MVVVLVTNGPLQLGGGVAGYAGGSRLGAAVDHPVVVGIVRADADAEAGGFRVPVGVDEGARWRCCWFSPIRPPMCLLPLVAPALTAFRWRSW